MNEPEMLRGMEVLSRLPSAEWQALRSMSYEDIEEWAFELDIADSDYLIVNRALNVMRAYSFLFASVIRNSGRRTPRGRRKQSGRSPSVATGISVDE
jgi:hypothetical protein